MTKNPKQLERFKKAARDAGCDEVMPKSQFSGSLPEILKRVLK